MAASAFAKLLLVLCMAAQVHGFVMPSHSVPRQNVGASDCKQAISSTRGGKQQLLRLRGGGIKVPKLSAKKLVNSLKMAGGMATSVAIVGSINLLGFVITLTTNTHKVTDLLGTGAFLISAVGTFLIGEGGQRALVSTVCVSLWSMRLAAFLFYRILKTTKDDRLTNAFKTPSEIAGFWVASALWGILCLLPHTLLSFSTQKPDLGPFGVLAVALFGVGFGVESIADWQKWTFKSSPESRHTWCTKGLWKFSRHPNYCGEILVWVSNFLLAAPSLARLPTSTGLAAVLGVVAANRELLLAALSPMFTTLLLTKVRMRDQHRDEVLDSGVPLAEARNDEKFGHLEAYQQYKNSTPILFPTRA